MRREKQEKNGTPWLSIESYFEQYEGDVYSALSFVFLLRAYGK